MQENTSWLCLWHLSIIPLTHLLIDNGRKRQPISFYFLSLDYLVSLISAFTKFSIFLLLLHFLPISSLCLISWFSSFIFPVKNLGSSHFSSLSSSPAFAFLLVFLLYHFYPSLPPSFLLFFLFFNTEYSSFHLCFLFASQVVGSE